MWIKICHFSFLRVFCIIQREPCLILFPNSFSFSFPCTVDSYLFPICITGAEWVLCVWALHKPALSLSLLTSEDCRQKCEQMEWVCTFLPGVKLFCGLLRSSYIQPSQKTNLIIFLIILSQIRNWILSPALRQI